ncbi:SpoIIE family protein phosphatase [Actinoallomurus sp. NPDC052274]|uniref:SpoIIE family protein phosphatase n=1 Tax=Actinoallomurus sp. NPDC052274 TaxID=3155420 RepID=UPI0034223982
MSLLSLRSVAGQVFLLQVVIVVLLVAAAVAMEVYQAAHDALRQGRRESLVAAEAFANAPGVVQALRGPNPTAVLQPRAEAARKRSGVHFIVVMNTHGIRYTYPYPSEIGKHFVGTIEPSLHGHITIENRAGGPSTPAGGGMFVQAVVPVFDEHGAVVGMVSAGKTVQGVTRQWVSDLPITVGSGVAALVLAAAGTALVSRRLRRQTHGVGPAEMTRMYEHHDAVLHAVREGVLITGAGGRLILANDEAQRLLGLPADAQGRDVRELGLPEHMTRVLVSGEPVTDEVHLAQDRLLAVNKRPTFPGRAQTGSVVTLRDTTELAAVSGRAQATRERLKLLYEAGVRIGTTLDVVREARELAEVAGAGFADVVMVDLIDATLRGEEPAAGRWRLRRVAIGGDQRITPLWPVGEQVWFSPAAPQNRALEQGYGLLQADLRQARGWQEEAPERAGEALEQGLRSLVAVPLQARGVPLGVASFYRVRESPAFDNEDLLLAEELTARAAVAIDNARRFTREHAMAVTLQRSLLPRRQPEQDALEVAWRYLPAETGVGGDWFDLIPLPGARVALVMGDVIGHGMHAAVTMGRLRTAAHNFATLDLPVEEVLWHLDELVASMDGEEHIGPDLEGRTRNEVIGATCLYGIYDPVAGTCTIARAGHPGPAVVYQDGTVTFPDVPASPPLGLGGYPFETTELHLPEGSRLVLYTDGLIEDRTRDIDTGLEQLRRTLQHSDGRTPEQTCQAVIDSVAPAHPADDVALLVARTRLLPRSHLAEWDVPADAAAVPAVRAECAAKVREWGLEEIAFTTELILSELVTNAIRYGASPIKVRLLHGRTLTCEVSDSSSTSPRLRRAATTDEGGRGLFLVAQLAERWGTRYTTNGKVIWADQALDGREPTTEGGTLADVLLEQFDAASL